MFKHLNDVCMDYREHFTLSIGFSFEFLKGSFYALIHALFPNMYASSTTKIVNDIQYKIKNSGCSKKI